MNPDCKMSWKNWRWWLVIVSLAVAIGLPVWSVRDGRSVQWINELHDLKVQRLQLARALNILEDNQPVVRSVSKNKFDIDSLKLSLIEVVKQQTTVLRAELNQLTVTDSTSVNATASQTGFSLHTLRVEFSVVLTRAIELLLLFDGVREVADWRPFEIRGCSLNRQAETAVLSATCVIDVYFFPELDT